MGSKQTGALHLIMKDIFLEETGHALLVLDLHRVGCWGLQMIVLGNNIANMLLEN